MFEDSWKTRDENPDPELSIPHERSLVSSPPSSNSSLMLIGYHAASQRTVVICVLDVLSLRKVQKLDGRNPAHQLIR